MTARVADPVGRIIESSHLQIDPEDESLLLVRARSERCTSDARSLSYVNRRGSVHTTSCDRTTRMRPGRSPSHKLLLSRARSTT